MINQNSTVGRFHWKQLREQNRRIEESRQVLKWDEWIVSSDSNLKSGNHHISEIYSEIRW
jgi:hypothetical protein